MARKRPSEVRSVEAPERTETIAPQYTVDVGADGLPYVTMNGGVDIPLSASGRRVSVDLNAPFAALPSVRLNAVSQDFVTLPQFDVDAELATSSAAERLAAVEAEIALLSEPLPPVDDANTDLDALAAVHLQRSSRLAALEAVLPAIQRDVLLDRKLFVEGQVEIEVGAADRAMREHQHYEQLAQRARIDADAARLPAENAARRAEAAEQRLYDINAQLDRLTQIAAAPPAVIPSPPATDKRARRRSPAAPAEGWSVDA